MMICWVRLTGREKKVRGSYWGEGGRGEEGYELDPTFSNSIC